VALKFYFDTHIAKAAALQLRAKGAETLRCEEVGLNEVSDNEHLQYAADHGYILVSQDDDFTVLSAKWHEQGHRHAGIMLVPAYLQGEAQISYVVRQLLFFVDAEDAEAVDYETEIANRVIYL
jgi:hypothetical protein